ncbi:helix-turn-helix transcriptional regulator [Actinokineospora bangkokensis]|uniref:Helix-turn-helix transcriptional regulator n=1 Tax=Actinokineospora bangkokensis TaxID=1193682 RepID=A0A1Q9LJK5_9PSEU|nr:LuxR C-terminal-related transcriptional regulator [Actinokineospora bangkokensis]OLR92183.1 helix-turn-helix transcriptional regulator [Actinokineospora bangkokensis]
MRVHRIVVRSSDPLLRAGALAYLGSRRDLRVLPQPQAGQADVVVLVENRVLPEHLAELEAVPDGARPHCVLVTDELAPGDLLRAIAAGVVAVLPLREVSGVRLVRSVLAAGDGTASFPAHLQGLMLAQLERMRREVLAPHGLTMSGLTEREADVLALVAEGCDTAEIATRLAFSERTVKNVLSGLMSRNKLNHRAHAVAFAARSGAF